MANRFDAIVVGAGPAGNAAALTLARGGLDVLQVERGEAPGTKNVQGAILYADALERVVPGCRRGAPLERPIVEQRMWMMDESSYVGTHFRAPRGEGPPGRYTILRAPFDRWFSEKVREAGALLICETTVRELLVERDRVVGVRTERAGGDVHADVVVLADGVNSRLAVVAGLRPELRATEVALAVKETVFLERGTLEARFNIGRDEGVATEMMGAITRGMVGTGFLYTNKESVSVGVGCLLAHFKATGLRPYDLLEQLKSHPAVAPLLRGGEAREFAAHLLPEGGYDSLPGMHGDGWVMVGDAAHLNNAVHREGSNLAMTSGRLAGEAILKLKAGGRPMTARNLSAYREALARSFVIKDLHRYRRVPRLLENNRQFFTDYPELVNHAVAKMLQVDGIDKRTKQREALRAFRDRRGLGGLAGDAFKLWRALGSRGGR
ncbi:MAG TPA: FAD-dependent oxidoreductase [Gammaproteobacteria bacterium]|nr:FAD-dependent oxidoreductase [Gammaproteobacteria bacterium]